MKTILITGGAGFIGSALIRYLIKKTDYRVVNIDKLTYAGNLDSLDEVLENERYSFFHVDICDKDKIFKIFKETKPTSVMHLAAESHVDRSIESPYDFVNTNVIGTLNLLNASLDFYNSLSNTDAINFRFHHISTDEVYGDLGDGELFHEETRYDPSSPYSASKASSDHLVRAWQKTFNLPTLITNCSNNYGPFQFPEKLIPHVILNAINGKNIPVYGDGNQVRDWLYVDDHVKALMKVHSRAQNGSTFNIGGFNEIKNIDVINHICQVLEDLNVKKPHSINRFSDLITFVKDRPGHDKRYAIDASKITKSLDWNPEENFESGIKKTVEWYLNNRKWWSNVLNGEYMLDRLGEYNDKKN